MARCSYHPDTETELSCTECGKPICPREMVDTPVGYKCPDCARQPRTALVRMKPRQLAGALAAGAAAGVGGGLVIGLSLGAAPIGGFFAWIIAFAWGGLVAEAVRRGSGGHAGAGAGAIAVAGVLLGALLGNLGLVLGLIGAFAAGSALGLLSRR